ncbi:apolipoprotein N-acyltransferase [Agromyces mangrovi Wang et al. 2018]|uniref:apolipoprotein N-acyltransferase n=1 Tax=Agromyces mangrovi TaxID=1858653 RepID=UPI0033068EC1
MGACGGEPVGEPLRPARLVGGVHRAVVRHGLGGRRAHRVRAPAGVAQAAPRSARRRRAPRRSARSRLADRRCGLVPCRRRAGQRTVGLLRPARARGRAARPARGDRAGRRRTRHRRRALARGRLRHRPDAGCHDRGDLRRPRHPRRRAGAAQHRHDHRRRVLQLLAAVGRGGGAVAQFDKRNPVPFGEYIPDRDFYYALAPDLVGLVQRGYSPGTNSPVFDIDGVLAGLAICFDVIYDDLIWEGARDGAQVYLLQTNNADFRGTDENLQQLAFARLRAIETGRPVVNLSTTGTSQVIAADGRTVDSLPAYEAGAMVTDVQLRDGLTPAVMLGGWVPWTLTMLGLAGLAFGWLRTRRTGRNP